MTKRVFIFSLMILTISIYAHDVKQTDSSKYFLIRHAEKIISNSNNPDLRPEGIERSENWASIFKDVSFDAIYSTNYKRTMNTVLPTAESQSIEIIKYHPIKIDYVKFMSETKGKTVLIVGHSNTIPEFVNNLIDKTKYKTIDENNNSNLYIVEINEENISDILLHIN